MAGRRAFAAILACGVMAAWAGHAQAEDVRTGQQLAYLQLKNIFHDGIRGTHTVALTFDDGPNENTRGVLAALDQYRVKATFFIVGKMAKAHPGALNEVAKAGHLLGNHTASHAQLGAKYVQNRRLLLDQIRQVDRYIAPLMKGTDTRFFRAPYGYWKNEHAEAVNRDPSLKYYVGPIYWDEGGETVIDARGYIRQSADWNCWERGWSAETCAKGYLREIEAKDGGVVLMHAINPKAAALVRAVVPVLQREGFRFVRLDEVKEFNKYKTPPPSDHPNVAMNTTPAHPVAVAELEDEPLPERGLARLSSVPVAQP